MPKLAPPPSVAPETWRALLDVASDILAFAPWEFTFDSDVVGLVDPVTHETRIACVLGNAGEVFGVVIYRRDGLRWLLSMLEDAGDSEDLNNADGMDCLKLEFVHKRELWMEDLAVLKAAKFKPVGRGSVWPQFRSADPGWLPWHLNQTEAEQLLADLPRLLAFCRMFKDNPAVFDDRPAKAVPVLPATVPDRALTPDDLEWHPLVPPPASSLEPYRPAGDHLEKLLALAPQDGLVCEFDSSLMPSASFLENGRPCFGRVGLLVEGQNGVVLGMDVQSGALPPGEAAGRSLAEFLLKVGNLPEKLLIGGSRLQPALQPLCDELGIQLYGMSSLPALEAAAASMREYMEAP